MFNHQNIHFTSVSWYPFLLLFYLFEKRKECSSKSHTMDNEWLTGWPTHPVLTTDSCVTWSKSHVSWWSHSSHLQWSRFKSQPIHNNGQFSNLVQCVPAEDGVWKFESTGSGNMAKLCPNTDWLTEYSIVYWYVNPIELSVYYWASNAGSSTNLQPKIFQSQH